VRFRRGTPESTAHPPAGGWAQECHDGIVELLEKKGLRILSFFLRCLIRPSLRHEKHRFFLFSRLDLLNRTDPGEAVRNVEYMLKSAFLLRLAC
jgi:hypothetical protein